jgi:hypothetical protein
MAIIEDLVLRLLYLLLIQSFFGSEETKLILLSLADIHHEAGFRAVSNFSTNSGRIQSTHQKIVWRGLVILR